MYPCTDHYLHRLPEGTLFAKYDKKSNFLGFFIKGKNKERQYFWISELVNPLANHEEWYFEKILDQKYISPEWNVEKKCWGDIDSYIYLVFEKDEIEYLIHKLTESLKVAQ